MNLVYAIKAKRSLLVLISTTICGLLSTNNVFGQLTEREISLRDLISQNGQVSDTSFRAIVFSDFSKLLFASAPVGKPINFASFSAIKPTAALNYSLPVKKFGFVNAEVKGGVESDLVTLVTGGSPPKSFNSSLSASILINRGYWFYGSDRNKLNAKIITDYDSIFISKEDTVTLEKYNSDLSLKNDTLKDIYKKIATAKNEKNVSTLNSLKSLLLEKLKARNVIQAKYDTLQKGMDLRKKHLQKIYAAAEWSTKSLVWITAKQNIGGLNFYSYDEADAEKVLKRKEASMTYESSVSMNGFSKSKHRLLYDNLLLSAGTALGRYNNFDNLVSSEYKESKKIDSASTGISYTKGNTYTVYSGEKYQSYHSARLWLECYKLLDKKGSFGFHLKFLRDMPYGKNKPQNAQSNLETGLVFNKISAASGVSKVSFEITYSLSDLDGRNLNAEDAGQKVFKRNSIGIKSAIPFNF